MFVFHLKNPTGTQDDFWKTFIIIWIFALSFGINAIFFYLPGDYPNLFYICEGKFPSTCNFKNTVPNRPLVLCIILTLILHAFVAIRYHIFEYKGKIHNPHILTVQQNITCVNINKMSIVNFATNCAGVISLSIASYVPAKINITDPAEYNIYPEYLWIYVLYFYSPTINVIFAVLVLTIKNPSLRKFMGREISESLNIW